MQLITYPGAALHGSVSLMGDKSLSHRAALLAALAEGESQIENFQVSGVTQAMLSALAKLGVTWNLENSTLRVLGPGWNHLSAPAEPIDCGHSATTLRLLAGALAASGLPAVLDGSPSLRRRPMERILTPLRLMDVPITGAPGDCAPLHLSARIATQPLLGIHYALPVASAQVKSCLLLAGLAAGSKLVLNEPGPSRDHTEHMLAALGCEIEIQPQPGGAGQSICLHPPAGVLQPLSVRLPGDFSSAAFLIVAALITPGSEVLIRNVGLNPTRTGLLDALRSMGGQIEVTRLGEQAGEPFGEVRVRASSLEAVGVSGDLVVRMIDEFPIFAVAACYAHGTTRVSEAAELRHKESDRISALCQELAALKVSVCETSTGFEILGPCPPSGGSTQPHSDHRLAMALAVAGLAAQGPVSVEQAEIIQQSFPNFAEVLSGLGARVKG